MIRLKKNIELKSKESLLEEGFVKINSSIYRKHLPIGYNVDMYVTVGVEDDFLNVAVLNEESFQPLDLECINNRFNQYCIVNYNSEIKNLIRLGIVDEV